jgi:uncharacterized membrane protein YhaH (DUF805 family)
MKMKWYLLGWKRFLDFSGRSRRKEYWTFTLINLLILVIVIVTMMATSDGPTGTDDSDYQVAGVIWNVLILSCQIRRLHDTGRSGWNVLWPLLPVIGGIVLFVYTVQDGEAITNEYGPNPKVPVHSGMAADFTSNISTGLGEQPQPFSGENNSGFCKQCGARTMDASSFCTSCGTHV